MPTFTHALVNSRLPKRHSNQNQLSRLLADASNGRSSHSRGARRSGSDPLDIFARSSIDFEHIAEWLLHDIPSQSNFLTGVTTYEVAGLGQQIQLFFGRIAEYLAGVNALGDMLFGALLIVILTFEPLGLFARYRKSAAFLDLFPFYRRNTFRRQRQYAKTARLH